MAAIVAAETSEEKFRSALSPNLKPSCFNLYKEDDDAVWIGNTYTGAILRIAHSAVPSSQLELQKRGFCVGKSFDEVEWVQSRLNKAKFALGELTVTIAPTLGCNLGCFYCFEKSTEAFQKSFGQSKDIAFKTRDFIISNLVGRRALTLRWFGGEPLLNTEALEVVAPPLRSLCAEAEIKFSSYIQTNGVLLSNRTRDILEKCGVDRVHITIDGDKASHDGVRHLPKGNGTYLQILHNIEKFRDDFKFIIRINVTKKNSDFIPNALNDLQAIDPARKLSIYFHAIYSHYNGSSKGNGSRAIGFKSVEEFAERELSFLAQLAEYGYPPPFDIISPKALPCSALKADALMIGPQGEIVKCDHEFGVSDRTVGSVEKGVNDLEKISKWLSKHPKNNPLCSSCVLLPSCLGYCESLREGAKVATEACPTKKFNHLEQFSLIINWYKSQHQNRALGQGHCGYKVFREAKREAQETEEKLWK